MSSIGVLAALRAVHELLDCAGVSHALVGGLAVSVRAEPRATRDVDIAIAVASDPEAEQLIRHLSGHGYRVAALVEQEAVGRLAVARLTAPEGILVDLLFASCGIEAEIVACARPVEIDEGVTLPVARSEELLAMKILSMRPRREQDALDARLLIEITPGLDLPTVRARLDTIKARGFDRSEPLHEKLATVLQLARRPGG